MQFHFICLGIDFGSEEEFDTLPDVSQSTAGISALGSGHSRRFFGAKQVISTGVCENGYYYHFLCICIYVPAILCLFF